MRIAYIGGFEFPDADVGAARVLSMGKALRDAGHSVVFFGIERVIKQSVTPRPARRSVVAEFEGFNYRSPVAAGTDVLSRLTRRFSFQTGTSFCRRLNDEEKESGRIDAVIAYQASFALLRRLKSRCTARRIPFICDAVEWYDRTHVLGGRFGPIALESELTMRIGQKWCDATIAISRFLEQYYSREGIPCLRVPPLVDLSEAKWSRRKAGERGDQLSIAFVGTAGRKELLTNALRGIALLGAEGRNCTVTIVGPSVDELRTRLGADADLLSSLKPQVRSLGRVSHEEALRHLSMADCSILLRQDARFANAGFPTKLVESLAMGVPVICNLTSDIGLYVTDGGEGIVVRDGSPEAFAGGLQRMLALPPEKRAAMRNAARRRAELSFDYRNWVEPLGQFLDDIRSKKGRVN